MICHRKIISPKNLVNPDYNDQRNYKKNETCSVSHHRRKFPLYEFNQEVPLYWVVYHIVQDVRQSYFVAAFQVLSDGVQTEEENNIEMNLNLLVNIRACSVLLYKL